MDVQAILERERKFDQQVDAAIERELSKDLSEYGLPPTRGKKVRNWYRELPPNVKRFVDAFISCGFRLAEAERIAGFKNKGYCRRYLKREDVVETIKQRVEDTLVKLGITEDYIIEKVKKEAENITDAKSRDRLAALRTLSEFKGMLKQEQEHTGEITVKYVNDWK